MSEIRNIRKDIKTGALPKSEVLSFALWLLAHSFWFWIVLILAGLFLALAYPGLF